jgi:hypothetical protein
LTIAGIKAILSHKKGDAIPERIPSPYTQRARPLYRAHTTEKEHDMGSIGYIANKPAGAATAPQKDTETTATPNHPKTITIPLPAPCESDARDLMEYLGESLRDMADTLDFVNIAFDVNPDYFSSQMKGTAATLAEQARTLAARADCAMGLLYQEWYPHAKVNTGECRKGGAS